MKNDALVYTGLAGASGAVALAVEAFELARWRPTPMVERVQRYCMSRNCPNCWLR